MRVITLTLAVFVLLGINANCRTPALVATACTGSGAPAIDCERNPDAER